VSGLSALGRRRIAVVSLAAAAVIVLSIVMRWPEASPASGSPAPAPAPIVVARAAPPEPPAASRREPAKASETHEASGVVTVLNAQLCSTLEKRGSPDWQCAAAGGDLQPGTYSFYTRVGTNAETTVEHRWYRDDRVHQVVRLRIAANATSGYRTFSSTTISRERTGSWRVEVRDANGSLLQEERFAVR
jgi:hypothetical protein